MQDVRLGIGEIVELGEVLIEVVQLPRVVVEQGPWIVHGDGLPATRHDAAVAEHLEVLHRLARGGVRLRERVGHRRAVQRHLFHTVHGGGQGRSEHVEHGRREVADVMELVPDGAGCIIGQPVGPVDDQRVAHAATVGVLLVELARRVARHRPPERIVVEPLGLADLVDQVDRLLECHRRPFEVAALMQGAGLAALLGGAVVAHHHEDRVGQGTDLLQGVDQTPDLAVGVGDHCRERCLEADEEPLFSD